MKTYLGSLVFVVSVLVASFHAVDAQEPESSAAFDVVETSSGTFLIDRANGRTWILKEGSEVHWKRVRRNQKSRKSEVRDDPRLIRRSPRRPQLEFQSPAPVSIRSNAPALIRIRLVNVSKQAVSRWHVSCKTPDGSKLLAVTEQGVALRSDELHWRGEELSPGASRIFEIQAELPVDQLGDDAAFEWKVEYDGGKTETHSQPCRPLRNSRPTLDATSRPSV